MFGKFFLPLDYRSADEIGVSVGTRCLTEAVLDFLCCFHSHDKIHKVIRGQMRKINETTSQSQGMNISSNDLTILQSVFYAFCARLIVRKLRTGYFSQWNLE